jgi:multicomponent Na+:H+ antiporter subunit D
VSELAGIGRSMPITMGAFTIGALSLIGIPPAAGFLSKWYILQGAAQSEHYFALAVVVASTLLNAAYFLPIVHAAFFRAPPVHDGHAAHGEAPWPMVVALVITAAATLTLFVIADPVLALARALGEAAL